MRGAYHAIVGQAPLEAYLTQIRDIGLLSAEEERDLADRVAEGDVEARNHLVVANLRLVIMIARSYIGRGVPLEDLIAEGNVGLVRAADGFDGSTGFRFSTYATYWIKQSIRRSLTRSTGPVRLPCTTVDLLGRWRRAAAALEREFGRGPTPDEVGARLSMPRRRVAAVMDMLKFLDAARDAGRAGAGDSERAAESLADERGHTPEADLIAVEEFEGLRRWLALLDDRESAVVKLRFGLEGDEPKTFAQVGRAVGGFCGERARQLEVQALAKLRAAAAPPGDRPGTAAPPGTRAPRRRSARTP